jgi:predicted ATPase/DNA-binding SARP family transcriptional activator
MDTARTTFEVLGPLRVTDRNGADVTPSGELQRRLLSMLLLHRGDVLSADRLTEAMWEAGPAPDGPAALHSHVSRLRKRIPELPIEFTGGGYALSCDDDALDARRFEASVSQAAATAATDHAAALAQLDEALSWWRGRPYADLDETDDGFIEIERLTEIRTRALEERFAALVALGRGAEAVGDLEALVAREPLRERPRLLLMEALSASGRQAEALRVYDAYRLTLADELGVAPSPEIRARHAQLLALDEIDTQVPSAPSAHDRSNEPIALPSRAISTLFGREDELASLADRLAESRLVSLIGPGGVGKTRLAVEVAHRVAGRFDDGVVFCDLTTVPAAASNEAIAEVVGAALRVESRSGVHPADRVAEVVRRSHLLLILDNCEHVLDGAAEHVERILGATEHLTVLVTSRERLAVDGETLVPVGPLECGAEMGASAARELFLDRACAAGARLSAEDEPAVDSLCRRLDGLPLALELAATRLHALTLQEVCAGVEESMAVLSGGRRTVARHRSLDAALDWSYRLLDDDAADALGAAAVFAAPFDAADAAALSGLTEPSMRDQLAGLVDRSLVFRSGEHFRLLETVRSFVRHQQPEAHWQHLRMLHARHICRRIAAASDSLRTADDDTPIRLVRRLVPELQQAFLTATGRGDAELAIDIVVSARDLAFDAMLPEPMTWGERAGEIGASADHPLTADAFAIAALGRWKRGDLDAMRRLLDRAVAESERLGLEDRYEVLGALGTEDLAHGELDRAADRLARSLRTSEAVDDVNRLAEGGATLAIIRAYAHDERAAADVAWLLDHVEPKSGAAPRSWCWYAAGECVIDTDPALARERLERAVAFARRSGAMFVEGVAGASLASVAVRGGLHRQAVEEYRWLLPTWLRAGVNAPFWTMLRSVIELLVAAGVDEPAARLLGAVTEPGSGHDVYGDDDRRLRAAEATLRSRLGDAGIEACMAIGRRFDDVAAEAEATAALDLVA